MHGVAVTAYQIFAISSGEMRVFSRRANTKKLVFPSYDTSTPPTTTAMSKKRKQKTAYETHKRALLRGGKAPPPLPAGTAASLKDKKRQNHTLPPHPPPPPPFSRTDKVLLVGEGDFSFALALKVHLGVRDITATCFDDEKVLGEKYPQALANITALVDTDSGTSTTTATTTVDQEQKQQGEEEGGEEEEDGEKEEEGTPRTTPREYRVLYSIDATKLLKHRRIVGKKHKNKGKNYDRIVFQFPHVGGKTKDQTRQVIYNQELLAGFFANARPLLTPRTGVVVVTLFEGLPYELWNIRALARQAGLATVTSFAFQTGAYPGYRHARTLGNMEGGRGWKGEDRRARMYIFGAKEEGAVAGNRKKDMGRKRRDDDDDD